MALTLRSQDAAKSLYESLSSLTKKQERTPIESIAWLPSQVNFLSDSSQKRLFRAGNQFLGKTTAGLADVVFRALGKHPFQVVRRPPVDIYVVCASWRQSVAIQEKLWKLLDKNRLAPSQRTFNKTHGFGEKAPMVQFKNGSVISFKTREQGAINLAGATIDFVYIDEPPDYRTYTELLMRTMAKDGGISIGMTPINTPGPIVWLKELVERGEVSETWVPISEKELIPVGHTTPRMTETGRIMDDSFIQERIQAIMPHEVPVVIHGEWETRVQGRRFANFRRDLHVINKQLTSSTGQFSFTLGIDYGAAEREWAQVVTLIVVDESGEYPGVFILDEWVSPGSVPLESVADAIQAMLLRNNLNWRDLTCANGDIPVLAEKRGSYAKSNLQLSNMLAKRMGLRASQMYPRIFSAKRGIRQGRYMVDAGERFLNECMVRPNHFFVHKRCEHIIESFERFDGSDTSKFKDPIDAVRYALKKWIFSRVRLD